MAVRRVAPDVDRIRKAVSDQWKKLRGQEVVPAPEYMEKLRSRKAEVDEQLDRSRSATRFEAPPAAPIGPLNEPLLEPTGPNEPPRAPRSSPAAGAGLAPAGPKPPEPESYTNRLLKAKQRVWEERDKDKGKP